jgi:YD repeat-containing protein
MAGWVADWDAPAAEDALDAQALTWELDHDLLGRVTRTRYPADTDGRRRELVPESHPAGGLRRVILDGDTYIEHIARNARGQRTLVAYGNGVLELRAYDRVSSRLRRVWSGRATAGPGTSWVPGGGGLCDTGYDHDLVGNVTAVRERAPGSGTGVTPDALDRSLVYDALYRLVASDGRECDIAPPAQPWATASSCVDQTATRPYRETYAYDAAGNLTEVAHVAAGGGFTRTLTPEPGSNRLARVDVGTVRFDYTYDAAGNLTAETNSRHLEWDHAGRLRSYRTQAGSGSASVRVTYLYDQAGRRVKRVVRKQNGPVESTVTIDDGFEINRRGAAINSTVHVMDDRGPVATVRVGPALPGDGGADIPVSDQL